MALIWEELGGKFRELLEMGRSGVVAALIAASQRLHTHERKVYYLHPPFHVCYHALTFYLEF